ncbi:MAG: hypothetical protein LBJ64_00285 [Deltaproteobacteria bacterium]|jgi:hypothetical protein|nr:hypothetical protein [Deltaproteobacteria bacterium]
MSELQSPKTPHLPLILLIALVVLQIFSICLLFFGSCLSGGGEADAKSSEEADDRELVAVAKRFQNDYPPIASAYYGAAVNSSQNKVAPLQDYCDWKKGAIEAALASADYDGAKEAIAESVDFLLRHVQDSNELSSLSPLLLELVNLGNEVEAKRAEAADDQKAAILEIGEKYLSGPVAAEGATDYETAFAALNDMTPFSQTKTLHQEILQLVLSRLQAVDVLLALDSKGSTNAGSAEK